ncbi:MAG: hypothetical protein HKN93_11885 [Acidimicrobiia bacterium]|nr:hypothetical protein [Acidimicrobiia bacterium]
MVTTREWDGLVTVIDRCQEAVTRGKQVWAAAHYAEYRLSLDAPADFAGEVVSHGSAAGTLGPHWEVAASTHTWADLEPHLSNPRSRALVAHERALRGDDVEDAAIDRAVIDLPLRLEPFEPSYPPAVYRPDKASFPEMDRVTMEWTDLPDEQTPVDDAQSTDALRALVSAWVDESSGSADVACAEGSALDAIRAIGPRRAMWSPVSFTRALGAMQWAGASGGAYGRRRGGPVGRAAAWWATGVILGMEDDWPVDAGELAAAAERLEWGLWSPGDHEVGWQFHLTVADPDERLAWAVSATDAV